MSSSRYDSRPRLVRHRRVRKRVSGDRARPRLSVFRSHKHIYAQIVDDRAGMTLAASSTLDVEVRETAAEGNIDQASAVGTSVARRALATGIGKVVFDRGGYLYHGRVRALAEAARAEGLEF